MSTQEKLNYQNIDPVEETEVIIEDLQEIIAEKEDEKREVQKAIEKTIEKRTRLLCGNLQGKQEIVKKLEAKINSLKSEEEGLNEEIENERAYIIGLREGLREQQNIEYLAHLP